MLEFILPTAGDRIIDQNKGWFALCDILQYLFGGWLDFPCCLSSLTTPNWFLLRKGHSMSNFLVKTWEKMGDVNHVLRPHHQICSIHQLGEVVDTPSLSPYGKRTKISWERWKGNVTWGWGWYMVFSTSVLQSCFLHGCLEANTRNSQAIYSLDSYSVHLCIPKSTFIWEFGIKEDYVSPLRNFSSLIKWEVVQA